MAVESSCGASIGHDFHIEADRRKGAVGDGFGVGSVQDVVAAAAQFVAHGFDGLPGQLFFRLAVDNLYPVRSVDLCICGLHTGEDGHLVPRSGKIDKHLRLGAQTVD